MKFSIVNPSPNEDLDERERRKGIAAFPPLGMLYLAAILQKEDIEVSLLDQPARGFTVERTVKWVEREDPDILGFSTFSSSGRTAALISHEVKKTKPDITIVFGNHYATFNSERVLRKYPSVDIIVRGEGEKTAIDLVNCLRNESNPKEVLGITFRSKNGVASTPDRPLVKDLDSLPFPARKLISHKYHCDLGGANVAPKKFTSIVTSRGCAFRCRFCSCCQFARNSWRPRSVMNTLEELHLLASEGYKQFIIADDSFTLNRKRVIRLCRTMRKEKIDMEWICEGRVDNCTNEMLQEIARAGCRIIYFGVESANQRILDYYNKQTTPQQSFSAVKKARKARIDIIAASFIVGAPDETRKEIQHTLDFAEQIPIDMPQFNILAVYPGTDLWREFEMRGLLEGGEYWETGVAIPEICPSAVPFHEIRQMIHQAFHHFTLRPSFILRQVARALKSSFRMEAAITNMARISTIKDNIHRVA